MTIKEVEKKLNITRANIRYYEKEGLLEPKRNENEYRNFSNHDIKRLEQILLFRKCNVSIEDIDALAYPVLRHRIKINYTAINEHLTVDDVIGLLISETKRYCK